MAEDKKLLTEDKAQQIAKKFLLDRYFESKVDCSSNQLVVKGGIQVYWLEGKITMHSRSFFNFLTTSKTANTYDFRIEIEAKQGGILSYEFV